MSRVADELGTGASFGRARGVSARRQAVAATTGVPTAGAPDSRLKTLPLEHLVPTRFNPRRNFGTDEDLLKFGLKLKRKQLQPAVAVTRDAYLELWPDEVDALGSAKYVIANGERRYRGSLQAALTTLEVVVDDDIAKSRADFLDAVLSENNDREDLDPIERALGIKTMVEQLGGKSKVAEHYAKSAGWVTQQMYLLDLAPPLQRLVSTGELPVRETRALVKLPLQEQQASWRARAVERQEEKALPRPARMKQLAQPTPPPDPEPEAEPERGSGPAELEQTFTAVKNDHREGTETPPQTTPEAPSFTAVKPVQPAPRLQADETRPSAPPVPVPREQPGQSAEQSAEEAQQDGKQPPRLPYDDGSFIALHLIRKMPTGELLRMLRMLNQHAEENGLEAQASADV